MDDGQRKLGIGEGLQESRINTEFLDTLQKHGSKVLYLLLIIVGGYLGIGKYTQWQQDKTNTAFDELEVARRGGSPSGLLAVADKFQRASVPELARLQAANILLESARAGVIPGVAPSQAMPEETLSQEDVTQTYQQALQHFTTVLEATKSDERALLRQQARWGSATAMLSLGQYEEARNMLMAYRTEAEALSDRAGVDLATARIDSIEDLKSPPVLAARADVPSLRNQPIVAPGGSGLSPELNEELQRLLGEAGGTVPEGTGGDADPGDGGVMDPASEDPEAGDAEAPSPVEPSPSTPGTDGG